MLLRSHTKPHAQGRVPAWPGGACIMHAGGLRAGACGGSLRSDHRITVIDKPCENESSARGIQTI
jgi:hypothetical protein